VRVCSCVCARVCACVCARVCVFVCVINWIESIQRYALPLPTVCVLIAMCTIERCRKVSALTVYGK